MIDFFGKLKNEIPDPVRKILAKVKNDLTRPFRTVKRNVAAERVTIKDLVSGIHELGLRQGDTVMVHSSLSSLGFVVGGPSVVVEALLKVVGVEGMVVMPAYPTRKASLDYLATNPLFHPIQSPSQTGIITEVFRQRQMAKRSIHPTHSLSAIGRDAEKLLIGHFRSITPFGPGTPFARLLDQDAWILGIGVDLGPMTYYHVFEDMVDFPIPVYYPEPQRARVLIASGEKEIFTKVHDPKIAQFRIDHDEKIKGLVTRKLQRTGYLTQCKIGDGNSYSIKARNLITALEDMLREGKTIYNTVRMYHQGIISQTDLTKEL
jgi:aminoglycoside N3'-acetyltransferase